MFDVVPDTFVSYLNKQMKFKKGLLYKLDTYYFGSKIYYKDHYSKENLKEIKELHFKYVYWGAELRSAISQALKCQGKSECILYLYARYIDHIEETLQLIEEHVEKIHKLQRYKYSIDI